MVLFECAERIMRGLTRIPECNSAKDSFGRIGPCGHGFGHPQRVLSQRNDASISRKRMDFVKVGY